VEDILGRCIYSQLEGAVAPRAHQNQIDLPGDLPTGLYFLKIHVANAETTFKIIKE
jgi:hypothetical protein